jgi:arylsulfatase A-like enzyme
MVGKWDSGRARRFLPPQRGFDFYYGFANTGIDYYTHERYGVPSMFRGNQRIKEEGHATDLFRREALRFIGENAERPFFLYLAPNAPHGASTFDKTAPQVPPEYLSMYGGAKSSRAQYRALITHLDAALGAIFDDLRKRQLENDTLVVFTSDNGGSGADNNAPLRGGKTQLFEGGIRVPMIARWPGRIKAGSTCTQFASTLELFPTFLAAAGAPKPDVTLDGANMLPLLEGAAGSVRSDYFWQRKEDKAARAGHWKWVESERGNGLFDLSKDIGEKHDLSKEKPDVLEDMRSRWAAWRKQMDQAEPRGPFRDY